MTESVVLSAGVWPPENKMDEYRQYLQFNQGMFTRRLRLHETLKAWDWRPLPVEIKGEGTNMLSYLGKIRGVRNGVALTVESYWSLYSTDDEWQLSGFCADVEGNPMESWGSFETPEKAALEVLDRFRTIHAIWERACG